MKNVTVEPDVETALPVDEHGRERSESVEMIQNGWISQEVVWTEGLGYFKLVPFNTPDLYIWWL